MDKIVGGVGLRRGRRSPTELKPGDALDWWRVILADRNTGRLILYAEMKVPGEAWLELEVNDEQKSFYSKSYVQTKWFIRKTLLVFTFTNS